MPRQCSGWLAVRDLVLAIATQWTYSRAMAQKLPSDRGPIPTGSDLVQQINELKKSRNAILLAHYYQRLEVQDIADFLGDSLHLAKQAASTSADVICFAGVHFMAETAKILNPNRTVVVPDINADCSMAQSCPPDKYRQWREKYPDAVTVNYINCSADIKAQSDWICTSSNAVEVVRAIDKDKRILFGPDKNLGAYVIEQTGRDMVLWNGTCYVHEKFCEQAIQALKKQHPDALFIAHPECTSDVLQLADFIGSTTALLSFVQTSKHAKFIIGTELGIIHQMKKVVPTKTLFVAPTKSRCPDGSNCDKSSVCHHMKLTTLEKIYLCLRDLGPQIQLPKDTMEKALVPMKRMLCLA